MRQPEPIFPIQSEHGEGPVWDPIHQQLYWVDLMKGLYNKVNYPDDGFAETHSIGQALGVMALREQGGVVMATRDGFGFYDESSQTFTLIDGSPEQHNAEVRFNDGAVDPHGRFFAGTMQWEGKPALGKLFRLDPDQRISQWEQDIFITNGMGWSPDQQTYYMIDTFAPKVYAYDYEGATGDIHNRRDFIVFDEGQCPDGMAVDSEGGFWIAMWAESKIIHLDPTGNQIEEFQLPVSHPTSCCFGGPDLKTLFITTSQFPLSESEKAAQPLAGRIFVLETDTIGQIEPRFNG